jgi:hypothetical protein
MKRLFALLAIGVLALFCTCQKQQTEADRNAEVERQVQQRLEAEHQAEQQQQLAQRQAELDAREKALANRESAATTTPQPQAPIRRDMRDLSRTPPAASYSTFYTRLEPLGVWRDTSTYGYVWQPREAEQSRAWRPYTNGRWVYTDAGWTWISEEPFGWATYHYGRWAHLRNIGWVWVPGDEWAPAWVSWRKGNDYVGWAPLPPEAHFDHRTGIQNWADNYYDIGPEQYCFVPTREFGAQRTERTVVPAERNITIVNQTTNVTDITYNNTTVVNGGPSYDELRARTQQPIERLRLERNVTVNVGMENPRAVVRGEVVEMPAPVIARAQAVERPRNVKETVAQTVVEHGWETIADHQAAEKARAKMKSESTPPPNAPPRTFVKPSRAAGQPDVVSESPRATAPTITVTRTVPPDLPKVGRPLPTATPTVAASPRTTPARPVRATATPVSTPMQTATPAATPTPSPRLTLTATPHPTFTPRALPQQFSPATSPSPGFSATPPAPLGVGPADTKQERRAQKELRKQERAERKREQFEPATPTPTATATPAASVSPSVAAVEPPGKRDKKKKRPSEPETLPISSATASP